MGQLSILSGRNDYGPGKSAAGWKSLELEAYSDSFRMRVSTSAEHLLACNRVNSSRDSLKSSVTRTRGFSLPVIQVYCSLFGKNSRGRGYNVPIRQITR